MRKTELGIGAPRRAPLHVTRPIRHVFAPFVPFVVAGAAADAHTHAVGVQTCFFRKVDYVEFYCLAGKWRPFFILHRKVKPLVVAARVRINPHIQVVLCRAGRLVSISWRFRAVVKALLRLGRLVETRLFYDHIEVAAFKLAVKFQLLLLLLLHVKLGIHPYEFPYRFLSLKKLMADGEFKGICLARS